MVPVTEPHSLPRCIQVFQQGSLFSRGLPLACVQCFEYQGQVRREGSSEQSAQVAIWPDVLLILSCSLGFGGHGLAALAFFGV
eukprot:scaffold124151_cov18-Tisochrysis_lutea.AAC.2